MAITTRHYPILRDYVREVAKDLVERGRLRRKNGQSIDSVIHQEVDTIIAEVAGDVRALGVELGVGAAITGVRLLELLAKQTTNNAVSAGVDAILGAIIDIGIKSRR